MFNVFKKKRKSSDIYLCEECDKGKLICQDTSYEIANYSTHTYKCDYCGNRITMNPTAERKRRSV